MDIQQCAAVPPGRQLFAGPTLAIGHTVCFGIFASHVVSVINRRNGAIQNDCGHHHRHRHRHRRLPHHKYLDLYSFCSFCGLSLCMLY